MQKERKCSMARVTKADLDYMVDRINGVLERRGSKRRVSVEYAYGQPRVCTGEGSSNLSPRDTKGNIYAWMNAFLDGMLFDRED